MAVIQRIISLNFLEGKKTFVVAALLVIYAIAGYFTGNLTVNEALQVLGLGSLGAAIRKAI